ncbi:DUF732 domain-containing protein [Mycobacterium sp. OTB74]|uniref:DUF732 domain-containing protein n=1 Tax=Mycobacterium sp. OTB74 TaxID=1853452 RepID=UPI0024762CFC|nr:DUF732 domain-containing protein [Mycobacterium sp. OTB74]
MKASMLVRAAGAAGAVVAAVALAIPAHADPDTDFANELHTYGIYGPKDYNAWIGKITCQRLDNGVDHTATDSAAFVKNQLPRSSNSEQQAYQFVNAAFNTYCPERHDMLAALAH